MTLKGVESGMDSFDKESLKGVGGSSNSTLHSTMGQFSKTL